MSSTTFIRRLLKAWVKDHPEDIHRDVAQVVPQVVPQAIKRMALRTGVSIFVQHDSVAILRIGVYKRCLPHQ